MKIMKMVFFLIAPLFRIVVLNYEILAPNIDREEDILMIQYADHDSENDTTLPRMVRWNDSGFAIPIFDEPSNSNDQAGKLSLK